MNKLDETDIQTKNILLLDLDSEIPLYQQIHDQVVIAISEGRLEPGSSLPTTRQLGRDFGINFHTVNKAYDLLRREGYVNLTRKHGSSIRQSITMDANRLDDWQARLRTLLAEAVACDISTDRILEYCRISLNSFQQQNSNNSDI